MYKWIGNLFQYLKILQQKQLKAGFLEKKTSRYMNLK